MTKIGTKPSLKSLCVAIFILLNNSILYDKQNICNPNIGNLQTLILLELKYATMDEKCSNTMYLIHSSMKQFITASSIKEANRF